MEKRLVKVLKALAEYHDMSLGDLLEGIVLHAFEGKAPFGSESLRRIAELKKIWTRRRRISSRKRASPPGVRRGGVDEAPYRAIGAFCAIAAIPFARRHLGACR